MMILIQLMIIIVTVLQVESLSLSPLRLYQVKQIKAHHHHQLKTRCYYKKEIDNSDSTIDVNTIVNKKDDNTINAYLLLNIVAIIYGTQHPIIKISMNEFESTSLVNFWRFFLSALLFSPAFVKMFISDIKTDTGDNDKITKESGKGNVYKAGIELGIYTFLGFAFQAIGLETTSASRSAFLLYLNVKFVPFLSLLLFKRPVHPLSWVSATLALIGTSLLSTDGGSLNTGDLWCICAAIASAMFILRLDNFSKLYDAAQLNSTSFLCVAFLSGMWVIGDMLNSHSNSDDILASILTPFVQNPWPIIYLGVITTGLCNYIQTIGQKNIPAEKAAIIYSLDPLYGAFFSWLWLNEQLGWQGLLGGSVILCGVYVSTKVPQSK